MNFLSDNGGANYNLCHCTSEPSLPILPPKRNGNKQINSVWSNFEIADLDFWRSEAYTAYFNYLDRHGGFYYEVPLFNITSFRSTHYEDIVLTIRIALG